MIEWFRNNVELLSLGVSLAMLAVWSLYLQAFMRGYRRQTRPKIIINRGSGEGASAHCFVSNMSSDVIYIESVVVSLESNGDKWRSHVTDAEDINADNGAGRPPRRSLQGALHPGESMDLGAFQTLLDQVLKSGHPAEPVDPARLQDPVALRIEIIADYASEDLLVGARRDFRAQLGGERWTLEPDEPGTEQIRDPKQRQKLREILRDAP